MRINWQEIKAFIKFWLLIGVILFWFFIWLQEIFSPPKDLARHAPTVEDKLAIDNVLYDRPFGYPGPSSFGP